MIETAQPMSTVWNRDWKRIRTRRSGRSADCHRWSRRTASKALVTTGLPDSEALPSAASTAGRDPAISACSDTASTCRLTQP